MIHITQDLVHIWEIQDVIRRLSSILRPTSIKGVQLNKSEINLRLCKAPQCTKLFSEIGSLDTYNVE